MPRHGNSLASDVSVIKYPDQDWIAFSDARSDWVSERQDHDSVLYCLTPTNIDASLGLYRVKPELEAAERDFSALCDRHSAIGACHGQFLRYALLLPQPKWPPTKDLQEFLDLGWEPSDIACVINIPNPMSKINHRLRAAAGRLISMPSFLVARDTLHDLWVNVPTPLRPDLPLARSATLVSSECLDLEPASIELTKFVSTFDRFCDEWHLLGLLSWDLPNVRGPHWVPELAPDDKLQRGELAVMTPFHFPVLSEDGLGPLLEKEHRRQAAERGIDDEGAWETYARLLEVHYWDKVLRERYGSAQRIRGFFTKMESVVGDILGLSRDRVQLLRKRLRALQSGKLKSLRGQR